MRTRVEIKWFKSCANLEQVNLLYKTLVMQHHPDRGGDLRTMQEINAERDEIIKNPSRLASDAGSSSWNAGSWTRETSTSSGSRASWWDWGGFREPTKPKPGHYKVKVVDVRENDEKKYVAVVFDICEGECEGYFEDKPWYKHCIYLSYKTDWQLKKAKRIIKALNASNPGFDGDSAFCDNRSYMFVNRVLGVKLTAKYIDGDGFVNDSEVFAV